MTLDKNIETILIDGGVAAMNLMTVAKTNEEAKRSYRLPVSDVTIWR